MLWKMHLGLHFLASFWVSILQISGGICFPDCLFPHFDRVLGIHLAPLEMVLKPCKYGDKLLVNWCRTSKPSTVLVLLISVNNCFQPMVSWWFGASLEFETTGTQTSNFHHY